ncbi:MAG: TRAP transporter substrate-binding protein DctP [Nitrospinaceae bacterium]|jgi:TRAP-type transport system periplasmic protein|nr:TRAP transporter substrate-binding protein DctP [Nitrospinaceae bacterium]MBT3433121.1 TRAP transporter substrate-binding protein DctP [Nitrospinaceae bacterium]MBT4431555.1 TRAP transporter substrate-binding protein DctP [Nitrospinaceae bacterium]MBT5368018.1 TRAP transporter substrate-binding protein DctP [Nitrospinaceae bacterium]MBT5947567.1 TRAP transporter substrate-binding protein DctP [Nitrospinaceae bacterium]
MHLGKSISIKPFALLAAVLLAFITLAVPPPVLAAKKQVIKFASLAPEGTTWMRIMRKLDKDMRKATKKAVRFRIYPGGVSGNEKDVVRKLRIGQLHAAGFTGVGLGELLPAARLFELPFFFQSYEEVDAVHKALDPWYEAEFRKKGWVLLGWSEVGFAHFFSKNPIVASRDLAGQKVWMWEGDPLARAYFSAIGVRPIPLAVTDVLTSLQTGLIDTVYISPLGAIALQWFTKVRYISKVPMANVTGALIMSKRRFKRMTPGQQTLLLDKTRARMIELRRLTRSENERAIKAMTKRGLTLSPKPEASELAAMQRLGEKAREKLAGTLIPRELIERAGRAIAKMRGGK